MANLPSRHPNVALHLTDRSLTPLISSSKSANQLQSLSSLSHTAFTVYHTACRLGLGVPRRVMVEHALPGPVLMHSFLSPESANPESTVYPLDDRAGPSSSPETDGLADMEDNESASSPIEATSSSSDQPVEPNTAVEPENGVPILLSTVVAPSVDKTGEARRAAAQLERVGKEVQEKWAEDQ